VVASSQGFLGIRAEPGRDLLVADGADATARAIGEVLEGRHPAMGVAARRLVECHYAWTAQLAGLDGLLAGG
jgi:hypothetical protein